MPVFTDRFVTTSGPSVLAPLYRGYWAHSWSALDEDPRPLVIFTGWGGDNKNWSLQRLCPPGAPGRSFRPGGPGWVGRLTHIAVMVFQRLVTPLHEWPSSRGRSPPSTAPRVTRNPAHPSVLSERQLWHSAYLSHVAFYNRACQPRAAGTWIHDDGFKAKADPAISANQSTPASLCRMGGEPASPCAARRDRFVRAGSGIRDGIRTWLRLHREHRHHQRCEGSDAGCRVLCF